ncbi:MAG: hypothetical protein K0R10_909 [Alphaproteobacteria bacterium]|jgi:hypothetical protein|nr:hypothetical protein [Alphaproteobacteria bacterium]
MRKSSLILAVALAATLGACSDVKKQIGMGRASPDEFMVVKRAPLTMPPDYDLRAPSPDSLPPASEASNQAKAALMGDNTVTAQKGSAEDALLQKMGAENADPSVRTAINRENGVIELENRKLVDKLIFWSDKPGEAPSSVVDAKQEKQRLENNEATGKPVNEGQVPVIEKKQSTMDKLF